jgi:ABC-type transporter Mla maintaining outer membrane lipid asymmetry ATPase subunit MlaF
MKDAPILVARSLLPAGVDGLSSLDLEVRRGEMVCLVGPKRTGKTQFLRALAGLEPPATGSVDLLGRRTDGLDSRAWLDLRRRAAFISADAPLLSVVDGLVNVMLPANYHAIAPSAQVREASLKLLERLGWEGDLTLLPAFLDEHQRRLLALARCLILKPVVLFVDEPFRMSDVSGWRHFGAVFEGLRRDDGLAVLLVTHNLPYVRESQARVLFCGPQGPRAFAHWREFALDPDPAIAGFLEESGFHAATVV